MQPHQGQATTRRHRKARGRDLRVGERVQDEVVEQVTGRQPGKGRVVVVEIGEQGAELMERCDRAVSAKESILRQVGVRAASQASGYVCQVTDRHRQLTPPALVPQGHDHVAAAGAMQHLGMLRWRCDDGSKLVIDRCFRVLHSVSSS
jgi:hypothetical protein